MDFKAFTPVVKYILKINYNKLSVLIFLLYLCQNDVILWKKGKVSRGVLFGTFPFFLFFQEYLVILFPDPISPFPICKYQKVRF